MPTLSQIELISFDPTSKPIVSRQFLTIERADTASSGPHRGRSRGGLVMLGVPNARLSPAYAGVTFI